MDIAMSLASLVKTNNGKFKSDKQCKFLLSQCDQNEYVTSGSVMENSFNLHYSCDDIGVTTIRKYTLKKGLQLLGLVK